MKKRLKTCSQLLFMLCCVAILFSGCRSVEEDDNAVTVATIRITPTTTSMNAGQIVQLSAAKLYTNSTSVDCSSEATWTSSNSAVASFSTSTRGLLSALGAGTTTISATCSGTTKSYTLTVVGAATLASLEVSPINKTIANGTKLIVIATGIYSDKSTRDLTDSVYWTSSDDTVVSMERSNGSESIQAKANSAGTATITASIGTVSGTTTIVASAATLASVIVTPNDPSLADDHRLYLKATGVYSDDTAQEITDFVTWSSSSPTVAVVSNVNNGVTDALTAGTSTITANSGGTTDTVSLTVSSATLSSIEVYPPIRTMVSGSSHKFIATGIYSDNTTIDLTNQVTCSASDTGLLSVDNTYRNKGRATSLRSGTVYLSASLPGSSIGASAVLTIAGLTLSSIEVTPKNPQLPANLDLQFKATGVFSNGSKQDLTDSVVWSSSATSVLKLNNAFQIRGRARSLAAGTATVTATFGSISGTSSATVSSATLSSIQITPPGSSLPSGYRRQLTATGIYSDNSSFDLTPYVSWQSSLAGIVMENVGPWQGLATATASGSTPTITASFKGLDGTATAVSGTTTLTTTTATLSSIEVSPANPTCMSGLNIQFSATGIFSDATTLDMTSAVVWRTSDYLVTTASNAASVNGQYHCVGSGTATITAATGSISGTTTLIVATQGASMADTPE